MDEGDYNCEKILKTVENIVDNHKDMPYLIADLTSAYLGDREIDYRENSKDNKILKQIKLTCIKYDETMKHRGDGKIISEIKEGYSNLICILAKGNTLEEILNQVEDNLKQSDDEENPLETAYRNLYNKNQRFLSKSFATPQAKDL